MATVTERNVTRLSLSKKAFLADDLINPGEIDYNALPAWVRTAMLDGTMFATSTYLQVNNPVGQMRAYTGDWVVQDMGTTLTVSKAEYFSLGYLLIGL